MTPSIDTDAFERATDPVLKFFTIDQARGIVQYRADEAFQTEIEELARKANEGDLSPDERAKYEGYVRANKWLAILQAKARKLLATTQP